MASRRHLFGNTALTTTLAALVGVAGAFVIAPGAASADPAVSKVNWKLDVSGGGAEPAWDFGGVPFSSGDIETVFKVRGAVSIPIAYSYGLQLDGAVGSYDGDVFGHGAAHLFWRDPDVALFGGYASWTHWNGVDAYRVGIEGEYYVGNVTLSGLIGSEFGDVDNELFSFAEASFYATEDLKLKLGHHYAPEVGHMLTTGVEYQFRSTPSAGYAVYAEADFGENGYQSIFGGFKMYFGDSKSLIRRHREDDPDFRDDLGSVISCLDDEFDEKSAENAEYVDGVFYGYPCSGDFMKKKPENPD